MKPLVKVAFCSGTDDANAGLIAEMTALFPELPLYIVSEFAPTQGHWIPYHVNQTFRENNARMRAALADKRVRLSGVLLVPNVPYRRMRLIALLLSPIAFLAFNEHMGSFMLRPRCATTIALYLLWRVGNLLRWSRNWLHQPHDPRLATLAWRARLAGWMRLVSSAAPPLAEPMSPRPDGISVVVPSRNGKSLLETLLPGMLADLDGMAGEVIVVDNGSEDGTAEWLADTYRSVRVEVSAMPLSFARAVNRGIRRARYSHVCLLNNDMIVAPRFFAALRRAFDEVPHLFCASAQILFPAGQRREETGKTAMAREALSDFPVRCDLPIAGEDLTYVLYGSGGCSLYDAAKLHALGCVNEIFEPAYVEDLDLGYRAWQRGWPTVYTDGAKVEHRHRSTTSRYYRESELQTVLEVNYLRFLWHAVHSRPLFRKLWREAISRLQLLRLAEPLSQAMLRARFEAVSIPLPSISETHFLALTEGSTAVFPGIARSGKPVVLIASPYLPFPLSHGGAVRMYNLMRRAAADFDQVLVAFCDELRTPPSELLACCAEIVLVRRAGSHSPPSTERPQIVEEFHSAAFHLALQLTVRKWKPAVAQLEFTQMAQYAADCKPARTILVEHDVTFDLYEQLVRDRPDWETARQLARWRSFETAAWRQVDCVVAMSAKDRGAIQGARAECLPNGVDLERFRPSELEPEPRRLLFIGSFAHLPNLLALDFFLREVWPSLAHLDPTLHIIAGSRPKYFQERYRERVQVDLARPGIELESFVSDVRPAYARATLVIAPLVVSAGTNIKILEAMAMGKAVVSTPAGVNGLDVTPGSDVIVTSEMGAEIARLLVDAPVRRLVEARARQTVERHFSWEEIAAKQTRLYRSLIAPSPS